MICRYSAHHAKGLSALVAALQEEPDALVANGVDNGATSDEKLSHVIVAVQTFPGVLREALSVENKERPSQQFV